MHPSSASCIFRSPSCRKRTNRRVYAYLHFTDKDALSRPSRREDVTESVFLHASKVHSVLYCMRVYMFTPYRMTYVAANSCHRRLGAFVHLPFGGSENEESALHTSHAGASNSLQIRGCSIEHNIYSNLEGLVVESVVSAEVRPR